MHDVKPRTVPLGSTTLTNRIAEARRYSRREVGRHQKI